MPHRFRTWTKPRCTCQSWPTHLRHGFLAYLLLRANPVVFSQSKRRDAVLQGREAHLAPWGGLGALLLLSRLPQHLHKLLSHPLAVPSTDIRSRYSFLPHCNCPQAGHHHLPTRQAHPSLIPDTISRSHQPSIAWTWTLPHHHNPQPTICIPSRLRLCVPLS